MFSFVKKNKQNKIKYYWERQIRLKELLWPRDTSYMHQSSLTVSRHRVGWMFLALRRSCDGLRGSLCDKVDLLSFIQNSKEHLSQHLGMTNNHHLFGVYSEHYLSNTAGYCCGPPSLNVVLPQVSFSWNSFLLLTATIANLKWGWISCFLTGQWYNPTPQEFFLTTITDDLASLLPQHRPYKDGLGWAGL